MRCHSRLLHYSSCNAVARTGVTKLRQDRNPPPGTLRDIAESATPMSVRHLEKLVDTSRDLSREMDSCQGVERRLRHGSAHRQPFPHLSRASITVWDEYYPGVIASEVRLRRQLYARSRARGSEVVVIRHPILASCAAFMMNASVHADVRIYRS
jgi:hypothetical protein